MSQFRRKPELVDAVQWWKNGDHPEDMSVGGNVEGLVVRYYRNPRDPDADFPCPDCGERYLDHGSIDRDPYVIRVCPGAFVVTEANGTRWACKPEVFAATYEPVP